MKPTCTVTTPDGRPCIRKPGHDINGGLHETKGGVLWGSIRNEESVYMDKVAIVVQKRSADFHASFQGEPQKWESGRSEQEAIGKLVISHPDRFGLTIQWPEKAT